MEGEREGSEGGDGEREIERGASITPLNLPVTVKGEGWGVNGGRMGRGVDGGEKEWPFTLMCWVKVSYLFLLSRSSPEQFK